MTEENIVTQETTEEVIKVKKPPFKIPYLTTTLNSKELRGLPITYIDPSVKSTVCIRYGFIEGIGAVNITVRPLNKFNNDNGMKKSQLKAQELGMKFIEVRGVNSEGKEVVSIIQEELVPYVAV